MSQNQFVKWGLYSTYIL